MKPFFLLRISLKPDGKSRGAVSKEVLRLDFRFFELLSVEDLLVKDLQILDDNGIFIHPVFGSCQRCFGYENHSRFYNSMVKHNDMRERCQKETPIHPTDL